MLCFYILFPLVCLVFAAPWIQMYLDNRKFKRNVKKCVD